MRKNEILNTNGNVKRKPELYIRVKLETYKI